MRRKINLLTASMLFIIIATIILVVGAVAKTEDGWIGITKGLLTMVLWLVFIFIAVDLIRLLNKSINKLLEKRNIKWRFNFFILLIVFIPLWIFIRAQFIYKEGPRIVKALEQYKDINKRYPATLDQAKIKSIFPPWYYYDTEKGTFNVTYSIFVFSRWCYDGSTKRWFSLD